MKVLHLPVNIASIPVYTVKALRQKGIDARALITVNEYCQSGCDNDWIRIIDNRVRKKNSPVKTWNKMVGRYYFLKYLLWADLLHWHFTTKVLPFGLDLKVVKLLKKPGVVEFHGSDIRIPEVEFNDNPYYKSSYKKESHNRSIMWQKAFSEAGFKVVIDPGDMVQYIQKDSFPNPYLIRRRLILDDFTPYFPDKENKKPLIIHAPSHKMVKGTKYVIEAVENLKKKYSFEFRLIENMERRECLDLVRKADIFLDQFILGWHGMSAIEAMAFGKPVVCYIKPSLYKRCPEGFPVVNASIDDLEDVLERLICDAEGRHETGKRSRLFVERYHDANKVCDELIKVYEEVIGQYPH